MSYLYLNTLQKDLEEDDWEEVEFQLKKKKLGTSIPRDEDLHGAAQALIRLQDVYELDIRDLSKGVHIIDNSSYLFVIGWTSNVEIRNQSKVQLFWEVHKISQLFSNCFDKSAEVNVKTRGR